MRRVLAKAPSRLVLAVAAVLGFGLGTISQPTAAEPYTQLLSVGNVGSQEAGRYWIPYKMGYFAKEGLEVKMQPTNGGTQEIQLMLSGQGDGGSVSVSSLMKAVQTGLKIKGVYLSGALHGTALAVLADGPIKTPADFKGKNIGTFSTTSSRNFDGQAMIAAAGLDPQKDVSWVPVGFGVQAMTALKNDSVAGLILWDSAYTAIENMGTKLKYFTFPFQDNLVGFTMVATEEKLKNERKKVIGFLRGLAKGQLFERANPDASACIYMEVTGKKNSSKDPKKELDDAANIIRTTSESSGVNVGDKIFGTFPKEKMEFTQQYYLSQKILNKSLPVEEYFVTDPSFYQEIADFDHEAVLNQAKNYPSCK
jgi:NitT/TauT family transport system substrate-binding protein